MGLTILGSLRTGDSESPERHERRRLPRIDARLPTIATRQLPRSSVPSVPVTSQLRRAAGLFCPDCTLTLS